MLKQSLAGRDDLSLLKILRYLQKHIAHTTYMPVLIEVAHIISHLYDFSSSPSDKNNKAMEKLQRTIQDELQFQLELMKTKGAIEIILAAASASTLLETNSPTLTNNNSNNNNTAGISSL
jgi:U3 small nucleolar RNA-associated protein 15